jgi:hypothetical protein
MRSSNPSPDSDLGNDAAAADRSTSFSFKPVWGDVL